MPAPDYLVPALHGEYERLTAQLTTPARVRDESVIARALHEGYVRGRTDALTELLTTEQVSAILGIGRKSVHDAAKKYGVGWLIGVDRLFTPADLETLRNRRTTRGRVAKGVTPSDGP